MNNRFCFTPVAIGVLLAFTAQAAEKDEATGDQSVDQKLKLEVVTVTAQRKVQNIQEVPLSVTAFDGDLIEKNNIKSGADYLALTPNVGFTEDGQTGSRGMGISIRGVNNLVSGETANVNSIGIYLDEFSVASVPNQVANPQLPDMESIEILRGPQGTFFGRNSLGGVLNITTKAPTDEFEGKIIIGGESYSTTGSQSNFTGIINIPVTSSFRMRGVYYYEDSSGMVKNDCGIGATSANCPGLIENNTVATGTSDSGHEYQMARLKTTWDISEATTLKTTLIYTDEMQGTDENTPSGVMDLDSADTFGTGTAIDPGTGFYPHNRDRLSHDLREFTKNESTMGVINVSHIVNDDLTLTSVTGFIDAELSRLFDNDLVGGTDALYRSNFYDGFSWSTELRAQLSKPSYDFTAGFLLADDEQNQANKVSISSNSTATINGVGFLPPFPEDLGLLQNTRTFSVDSVALFADYTFHSSDKLDLIAGARYTRDKITNEFAAFGIAPTCCFPGSEGYPGGPGYDFYQSFTNMARPPVTGERTFTDFSPRLVARYELNDDVNLYGTISKGYKAGGTSLGNNTNAGDVAFSTPFEDETLWNYEAGLKGDFMENRLRLNTSIYRLEWSDLQLESFRFLTPGDLSSNFEQTINIADAEAYGFETEFIGLITENFTLSGGLGYQESEITSATSAEITGGFVVNLQGLEIPKAPKLTANLVGEYRWYLDNSDVWLRLELIHRDGQYSDVEGLTNKQTRGPSPNSGIVRAMPNGEFPYLSPDYNIANLRAGWNMEKWAVSFYIQNLTDKEYYTGTQENFGVSGIRLKPHPRVIGASISYRFE
jgi:iron complex outermembrane receptor protein